tara:strand:+ start:497 stop:946 length:450 start_codon:yes stop_codon:yes gene_type:complete
MSCLEVQILNRIKTIISQDYSSGFSGLDISSNVVIGATINAPIVPSANITYIDTIEQQGRTLGRYFGESVYQIICYAGGSSLSERLENVLNLANDIKKSITIDRTLGLSGATEDVLVNLTATDGEEFGISQTGVALLEVRVSRQRDLGV